MKILSWNINGIRASKVDLKKLFDDLNADVICLQETKVTRDMLDEPTAIVSGYNSYFSFSRKRSGYSGVATFCKNNATPVKAEEGLAGVHITKGDGGVGCYGDLSAFTDDELESLDAEGRAVITQHKFRSETGGEESLAVINVYCPRVDPEREDRHLYKLRFLALLQTRAEALLQHGIHVLVVGDINTIHKAIDHCDPGNVDPVKRPSRLWLNQFLWPRGRDPEMGDIPDRTEAASLTPHTQGGLFVDTLRHLHPDIVGAYTNWMTLTNARATNYGQRLDYILGDVDLVTRHLEAASVLQDINGSDHCPVNVSLNVTPVAAQCCPPLCTKLMPEFSGTQQKLSMYFSKVLPTSEENQSTSIDASNVNNHDAVCEDNTSQKDLSVQHNVTNVSFPHKRVLEKSNSVSQSAKRLKTDVKKSNSGGKQYSMRSFFSKTAPGSDVVPSNTATSGDTGNSGDGPCLQSGTSAVTGDKVTTELGSCSRAAGDGAVTLEAPTNTGNTAVSAWKSLLGGLGPTPLCKRHREPCVLRMVKKPGPNKGKQFYTCARGEGHKSNPEARCDFFKWVEKKT